MKNLIRLISASLASLVLSACITPKAYVDPQYHRAGYEELRRPAQPAALFLEAQFQRNGSPLDAVNSELRGDLERTLRATGVFTPSGDAAVPTRLSVTANNIADLAAARAKGFGTGLTFGAAGSMVDDNYEFTFVYQAANGQAHSSSYQHAIHTAIGNTEGPAGQTPTTLADAFGRVVEDSVLNFVKDLQAAGLSPQ